VVATRTLWNRYQNPRDAAELHGGWPCPYPCCFALLAIPLAKCSRGKVVYAIFSAILIYIFYINLLFVTRN